MLGTLRWLFALVALVARLNVVAASTEDYKANYAELKLFQAKGFPVDLSAFEREINYENLHLSQDSRDQSEAQKFIQDISLATQNAYDRALKLSGNADQARQQVLDLMMRDQSQLDTDLFAVVEMIVVSVLDHQPIDNKILTNTALLKEMREHSLERQTILSKPVNESASTKKSAVDISTVADDDLIGVMEFKTKEKLIAALVAYKVSERWVSMTNSSQKTIKQTTNEDKRRVRLYASFMGLKTSGGKNFEFKRKFQTEGNVSSEGSYPAFDENGFFDFARRDADFKPMKVNGRSVYRHIYFTCTAEVEYEYNNETAVELRFENGINIGGAAAKAVGAAGSIIGINDLKAQAGGRIDNDRYFGSIKVNSVSLSSRRVQVPITVAGKRFSWQDVSTICHEDYLNAKVNNGKTIKENLDTMARNIISGYTFTSEETTCGEHTDCIGWFNDEVAPIYKVGTTPRCLETANDSGVYTCQLRGLKGSNCRVESKDGHLMSSGMFEYPCAEDHECVVVKPGTLYEFLGFPVHLDKAIGQCVAKPKSIIPIEIIPNNKP